MSLLDLVFPKTCLSCGKEGNYICSDCVSKVRLAKPVCPVCEKASIDGLTHTICLTPWSLDGSISIWEYEGIIRKAILALKYKYATQIAELLNDYIVGELGRLVLPSVQCLVPIPIFWYRQNVRGFNQSVEVGRNVALKMGWKFLPDLLVKTKTTTPQAKLKGEERTKNLKGVFAVSPNFSRSTFPSSIILFDDVATTGSTLKEAAKVLKRSGVEKVWGLTIAR